MSNESDILVPANEPVFRAIEDGRYDTLNRNDFLRVSLIYKSQLERGKENSTPVIGYHVMLDLSEHTDRSRKLFSLLLSSETLNIGGLPNKSLDRSSASFASWNQAVSAPQGVEYSEAEFKLLWRQKYPIAGYSARILVPRQL